MKLWSISAGPGATREVAVPGYDIKILPPSGVVGEAMLWMITAQVWREVQEHNAAVVKR